MSGKKMEPDKLREWVSSLRGDDPHRLIGWLCGALRGNPSESIARTLEGFKAHIEQQTQLHEDRGAAP